MMIHRLRRAVLTSVLSAAVLAPRVTHANPTPTIVDKTQTAKEYVAAGLAAQKAGDYDTAISMYGKAYALVPHPVLLFNMAQANRLAGRMPNAIVLYKQYIAADPTGAQAATAQGFVDAYIAKLAADEAARKATLAETERAKVDALRAADAARQQEAARKQAAEHPAPSPSPAPPTTPDAPTTIATQPTTTPAQPDQTPADGPPLRTIGIVGGGVGVVALAVSIGFGVHANSLANQLSQLHAVYDPDTVSSGQAANRNMIISGVVGLALIGGGVTLFVLGGHHHADDGVAVRPLVFGDGGGLALSGSLP